MGPPTLKIDRAHFERGLKNLMMRYEKKHVNCSVYRSSIDSFQSPSHIDLTRTSELVFWFSEDELRWLVRRYPGDCATFARVVAYQRMLKWTSPLYKDLL